MGGVCTLFVSIIISVMVSVVVVVVFCVVRMMVCPADGCAAPGCLIIGNSGSSTILDPTGSSRIIRSPVRRIFSLLSSISERKREM